MRILGIKETCIYISDIRACRRFYHDLLLLEIHQENEHHIFFRAGSDMLLCFLHGTTDNQEKLPSHFATGEIHFAFEVSHDEYELWKSKVLRSGIIIEHETDWKNNSKSFYFRDPDRNCVEILSPGLWD